MGFRGIKITSNGQVSVLEDMKYEDMSEAVEGWIECVHLPNINADLWVNEEFTYKFGPERINTFAMDLCGLGGRVDLLLSGILGNVLVSGPVDDEGNTTDVTEEARRAIHRIAIERG